MAAFGPAFVEARTELRLAVANADHGSLRPDDDRRRHMLDKPTAKFKQRTGNVAKVRAVLENDELVGVQCPAFLFDKRVEQIILVLKIDVDRALRDAGLARDVIHRGGIETHADEHFTCASKDLAAFGRVLSRADAATLLGGCFGGFDFCVRCLRWFQLVVSLGNVFEPLGSISLDMRQKVR